MVRIGILIALLHRRGTSLNQTSALKVAISRLSVRSEVFHTELQSAKLDYIASLQLVIVQDGVRLLTLFLWLLLRFEVSHHDEHHIGDVLCLIRVLNLILS